MKMANFVFPLKKAYCSMIMMDGGDVSYLYFIFDFDRDE